CRKRIRRNELSFPRRKSLPVSPPSLVPLRGHAARLVNPRPEHPLQISAGSRQRLPQINLLALLGRRRDQRLILGHIDPGNPRRFPVSRPYELGLGGILRHIHSLLGLIL